MDGQPRQPIERPEQPTQRIETAQFSPVATSPTPQAPVKRRRRWPIVTAVVVVILAVAGVGGFLFYRDAQQTALASCRTAVTEFSKARKDLLDTTDKAPEGEQLIRRVLGVDDLLDAVSDALDAAEGTIADEGCAANATPIQLNIVADTLRSATDSLNESVEKINDKIKSETSSGLSDLLGSLLQNTQD